MEPHAFKAAINNEPSPRAFPGTVETPKNLSEIYKGSSIHVEPLLFKANQRGTKVKPEPINHEKLHLALVTKDKLRAMGITYVEFIHNLETSEEPKTQTLRPAPRETGIIPGERSNAPDPELAQYLKHDIETTYTEQEKALISIVESGNAKTDNSLQYIMQLGSNVGTFALEKAEEIAMNLKKWGMAKALHIARHNRIHKE
ncbi:MAG: hypothetical protein ACREBF_00890 [Candidatus Micrarchaeales archaeon]